MVAEHGEHLTSRARVCVCACVCEYACEYSPVCLRLGTRTASASRTPDVGSGSPDGERTSGSACPANNRQTPSTECSNSAHSNSGCSNVGCSNSSGESNSSLIEQTSLVVDPHRQQNQILVRCGYLFSGFNGGGEQRSASPTRSL